MFTSFDKAIAALVTPILSLLVLVGFVPEDVATPELIGGITSLITAAVVWFVPNKSKGE